jgi:3-oxoacyl-[acyl-carrier protein] reductase
VITLDATRPSEVEAAASRAAEDLGHLDGIANCVGSLLLKPAHLTSDEEWASTLAINLTTSFGAIRAAARSLGRGGSVVLVASAAARLGLANHEAIAAAKAGVIGLTLSAAATYAPRGVRVNALAPGLVRTPLTARITGSETALKASTALHALGRVGEADEVAAAMAWLLDPDQSWITGQVLGVDGGLASVRSRG